MKRALLIAGGGTLGSYTAQTLLEQGVAVDVICLEDNVSDRADLRYYKANATTDYLRQLFRERRYDGIVNFIHYPDVREYEAYHALLSQNTDHLIFLSSYRVYADLQHPITESAPQLLDVVRDDDLFLQREDYALPKSRAERYLQNNPFPVNWTVVRPVISFSHRRLDINLISGQTVVEHARAGKPLQLPAQARHLTAGLDWAGNSGKMIASLLWKDGTVGEAYTVSSAQNLTWEQVAEIYADLLGLRIEWVPMEFPADLWIWKYDRRFDRAIDNTKIRKATGLSPADFRPIAEGVAVELKKLGAIR